MKYILSKFSIAAVLVLCLCSSAFSLIQELRLYGGRSVGKGGAVTADITGAEAIFFNPAAITDLAITNYKSLQLWVSYGNPYESAAGINLYDGAFAATYDLEFMSVGLGMKSTGDFNSLINNFIYLSGASLFDISDLELPIGWFSLGASFKIVNIHAANLPTGISGNVTSDGFGITFDLGLKTGLMNDALLVGLYARNVASTSIKMVNSGTGDQLSMDLIAGIKYNITKTLDFTLDYNFTGSDHSVAPLNLFGNSFAFKNLYMGLEFRYFDNLKVYCGFNEGALTMGIGITDADFFTIDAGLWVIPGLKLFSEASISFYVL